MGEGEKEKEKEKEGREKEKVGHVIYFDSFVTLSF